MKTVILSLSILFGVSSSSFANPTKEELNKELNKTMVFPDNYANEGVVFVSFFIDDNGDIVIDQMNGSDTFFSNYVQEKLCSINVKNITPNELFTYKFNFKKEN